jgi:uncharacterized protein
MDAYKTHGAFSWAELSTSDPQAAAGFYAELFGWTLKTMDMGTGPYHVAHVGETAVGGIMQTPADGPPMPPHWGSYVTVDDCDATVARCQALGGQCLVPPMDIPTVGRMAVIQDPQGAVISVMTYVTA